MESQISLRLSSEELAILDAEVSAGRVHNRSDAVKKAIACLGRYRGYSSDAYIMAHVRASGEELYPDLASFPLSGSDLP